MTPVVLRKLSHRLNSLYEWIIAQEDYDNIWDLCCDHGRLGLHLHHACQSKIYLVDRVPSIIEKLRQNGNTQEQERLAILCQDASSIVLNPDQNNLVILSGIGGENVITILEEILKGHRGLSFSLMISTTSHAYSMRKFLQANHFSLIKEAYVHENGWHFEHLHLHYVGQQQSQDNSLTLVGSDLWKNMTEQKKAYLNKLIQHYKIIVQHQGNSNAEEALNAYCALQNSFRTETG